MLAGGESPQIDSTISDFPLGITRGSHRLSTSNFWKAVTSHSGGIADDTFAVGTSRRYEGAWAFKEMVTMQIRSKTAWRGHCSTHEWSTPMVVAGMRRWLCKRCGEITLELTSDELTVPDSLRVSAGAH